MAVLSGPNHAEEVAREFPTASVVASESIELARHLRDAISSPVLRVYASRDVVGVELCAAAKNVMGLAAGISDGLGFGDNAKAAIITRGMAEMFRLGAAFGAEARTYAGMAGMGDLVADLHLPALAQPAGRGAAGPGSAGGLDRVRDRPGRRGPDHRAGAGGGGGRAGIGAADHLGGLPRRLLRRDPLDALADLMRANQRRSRRVCHAGAAGVKAEGHG